MSAPATTTGFAYFAGNVGVGTTSPYGLLSVNANNIGSGPAFVVGSSTKTSLIIDNFGKVGIGSQSTNSSYALTVSNGLFSASGGFRIAASGSAAANHGDFAYTDSTGNLNYTTTATPLRAQARRTTSRSTRRATSASAPPRPSPTLQ